MSTVTRITTYREFSADTTLHERLRGLARDCAIFALSHLRAETGGSNWIRFPYYHHVFDDERADFARQLRWFRDRGDIISIDDAVACLESTDPIDGRYFCLTFDDGYRNCITNAVPILVDHGATSAFFVATRYIGASIERDRVLVATLKGGAGYAEYLDWDECRRMVAAGMTIGSHSVSHEQLSSLTEAEVEREMQDSKVEIERELGMPCDHFCCPSGRPGLDFRQEREPAIAQRLGYRSFFTTRRGRNREKPSPMQVTRDHMLAGWETSQLRYFFAR